MAVITTTESNDETTPDRCFDDSRLPRDDGNDRLVLQEESPAK
jgi:hypothetical protein